MSLRQGDLSGKPDQDAVKSASVSLLPVTPVSQASQPQRESRWSTRIQRIWSDTWVVEAIALTLSIAATVCLGATLAHLDNRPLPSLPSSLTLNAIVAILSTIAKSSLILVVSSCISQLKWNWFQQSHRLGDTQLFDNASRGPLGALQMLIEHRGRSIACLGAVVLVFALLFDPFTQQAVVFPNILVQNPSALATVNQSWGIFGYEDALGGLPLDVRETLLSGIWSSDFKPMPNCPTLDCQWDTFPSLGLCSSCGKSDSMPVLECDFDLGYPQNVTLDNFFSLVAAGPLVTTSCNITFRNGRVVKEIEIQLHLLFYDDGPTFQIFAPAYGIFQTYGEEHEVKYSEDNATLINETIQGVNNPLLALSTVHFNLTNTSLTVVDAEECTLNYCLRDYTYTTTNGTSRVDISNIRNGAATKMTINDAETWCWIAEGQTFTPQANNPENLLYYADPEHFSFCYNTSIGWFNDWGEFIFQRLQGNYSQYLEVDCPEDYARNFSCSSVGDVTVSNGPSKNVISAATAFDPEVVLHIATKGLGNIMPNVADAITLLNLGMNQTNIIKGTAGGLVAHVHVRWAWLVLPFLLVVMGIALFICTMLDANKRQVALWKSSVLALVYHGLEAEELERQEHISERVSGMERAAANVRVRLQGRGDRNRTMLLSDRVSAVVDPSDSASKKSP